MKNLNKIILVTIGVGVTFLSQQVETSPDRAAIEDAAEKSSRINQEPRAQYLQAMRSEQIIAVHPLHRDRLRVTLNDHLARRNKIENMIKVLDKIAYGLSKPVAIIKAIKIVADALPSLVMSAFIYSNQNMDIPIRRNPNFDNIRTWRNHSRVPMFSSM